MSDKSSQSLESIFTNLALDLRLPLLQIKTAVEATNTKDIDSFVAENLLNASQTGLRMIEGYLLATSLYQNYNLVLEPVSLGQLLEESAHELDKTAKAYDTGFQLELSQSLAPALTHRRSAFLAITCMGEALIKIQNSIASETRSKLILRAKMSKGEIKAGMYGSFNYLSGASLERIRGLSGRSQNPSLLLPAHSSSGLIIADRLFSLIAKPLKSTKHAGLAGLYTSFEPTQQLPLALK